MDVDPETAASLGWPKLKYAWVERERRWLCQRVPMERVVRSERITDLYITGTSLRLREAVPLDDGKPLRRLGRKADVTSAKRLLTSIYLAAEEHALLSALSGSVLRKTRHYLGQVQRAEVSVDVFQGELEGLVMAEAEFDSDDEMERYQAPDFALREVTHELSYTGGELALRGLPEPL